ncbi:MAG: DUF6370 family protein [Bacteroidota bacterium]|jgi:hypothetical protein
MKKSWMLFLLCSTTVFAVAKEKKTSLSNRDSSKTIIIAEAACGECQFKMPGSGCDLAVRIEGVSYFVDGTDIDAHGDAHENDGFCNAIRTVNVQGIVKNGRFAATYFQLQPTKPAGKMLEEK